MTKVACIGAGSWGTTVAGLAAQNANEVVLWCRRAELADQINRVGVNEEYLPGIPLPEGLRATADIGEAMQGAEVCVMGVPSHGWREILRTITPYLGLPFASVPYCTAPGVPAGTILATADSWQLRFAGYAL